VQGRERVGKHPIGVGDAAGAPVDSQKKGAASFEGVSPLDVDRALLDVAPASPMLTPVFVLLSAWWVKGPILIAIGLAADLWSRRVPIAAAAAGVAMVAASIVVTPLKAFFERPRPPQSEALVAIPENASFPSGHSATAFAAATAVAIVSPRLRPWVLALAAAVALSRVYLRVHFPLDIVAGGLIGAGLGAVAALAAVRVARPA
jgi:membrane-associated phospholipid phosphatase